MFNNPYMTNVSLNDRIDNEIERLKQMKSQVQQPAPITQNFQLAPQHTGIKYVNTIDEVKKEMVYIDTPFFSKDLSVLWLKNNKGDIKAYELKEIVQKDDKDIQIEYLMNEIEELKGMIKNEQHTTNDNKQNVSTSTTNADETTREQIEDDKSTNVQRVSRSKKQ